MLICSPVVEVGVEIVQRRVEFMDRCLLYEIVDDSARFLCRLMIQPLTKPHTLAVTLAPSQQQHSTKSYYNCPSNGRPADNLAIGLIMFFFNQSINQIKSTRTTTRSCRDPETAVSPRQATACPVGQQRQLPLPPSPVQDF